MATPIISPLHVSELSTLQSGVLDVVACNLGRVLVNPDGYVNDGRVADDLRFLGIVAAL
ncbi:hypothetical protein [Rhodococcus sp. NCIMB 12038]|uniref:hypothetical protein n=1 Tax=Rhodococcus sp. NCIMB 12038 TaxID=933800 RepID=UPI0015C681E3|nr:hypothetical protein [Rhodococcus sp. NCIMB 12038]